MATRAVLAIFHPALTASQSTWMLILGTISGDLPDIDVAIFSFTHLIGSKTAKKQHRSYVTHTPIFWLAVSAAAALIGLAASSAFILTLSAVILAGSWSHLLFDSIEYGVRWLWPFSDRSYALRYPPESESAHRRGSIAYYWEFISKAYFKNLTSYAEILVTLAAIWLLVSR